MRSRRSAIASRLFLKGSIGAEPRCRAASAGPFLARTPDLRYFLMLSRHDKQPAG
jgi:hypothetical protein